MSAPVAYDLDLNTLTVGELEDLEEIAGDDALDKLGRGSRSVKLLRALYVIARRRVEPGYQADAARLLSIDDIAALNVGEATGPNGDSGDA